MLFRSWSSEEVRRLIKALEQGKTATEMAEQVGRSKGAVYAQVAKLKDQGRLDPDLIIGLGRAHTDAEYELMQKMRESGMSWKDIAEKHFPWHTSSTLSRAYAAYWGEGNEASGKED